MNTMKLFAAESENTTDNLMSFVKGEYFRSFEVEEAIAEVSPEFIDSKFWPQLRIDFIKAGLLKDVANSPLNIKHLSATKLPEGDWKGTFSIELNKQLQIDLDFVAMGKKVNYRITKAQITNDNGISLRIVENEPQILPLPKGKLNASLRNELKNFKNIDELALYVNSYGDQLEFREHLENNKTKLEGIVLREALRNLLMKENFINSTWKVQLQDVGGHRGNYIFTAAPNARRNTRLYGEVKVTTNGFKVEKFAIY